ncbi:MAG: hypothetical protein WCG44_04735 [bacterium]
MSDKIETCGNVEENIPELCVTCDEQCAIGRLLAASHKAILKMDDSGLE